MQDAHRQSQMQTNAFQARSRQLPFPVVPWGQFGGKRALLYSLANTPRGAHPASGLFGQALSPLDSPSGKWQTPPGLALPQLSPNCAWLELSRERAQEAVSTSAAAIMDRTRGHRLVFLLLEAAVTSDLSLGISSRPAKTSCALALCEHKADTRVANRACARVTAPDPPLYIYLPQSVWTSRRRDDVKSLFILLFAPPLSPRSFFKLFLRARLRQLVGRAADLVPAICPFP